LTDVSLPGESGHDRDEADAPEPPAPLQRVSHAVCLGAVALDLFLIPVTLGAGWVLWSLALWRSGRTPAKQILHLRVVHPATGAPAGFAAMAKRALLGPFAGTIVVEDAGPVPELLGRPGGPGAPGGPDDAQVDAGGSAWPAEESPGWSEDWSPD
jgi:hypothetical protein